MGRKIKFLYEDYNNIVSTGNTIIYPVTTINAVYDTANTTLKDVIYGDYNGDNDKSGIFAWLKELSKRFSSYAPIDLLNKANVRMYNLEKLSNDLYNYIKSVNTNYESLTRTFSSEIKRVENMIYLPEFDQVPTKGSTNILSSGALYSYFSKLITKNMFSFKTSTDLDKEYDAYDRDIYLYIGPTDKYVFGSLYMANIEYGEGSGICGEGNRTVTWDFLGSLLGEETGEFSNYYTKSQVDTIIRGIKNTDTKYYAGKNISIDSNNFISAIVPEIDLSNYYTSSEINEMLARIKPAGSEYIAGENISIKGNIISAIQPDTTGLATEKYVDDKFASINQTAYKAGDNIYIANNTISASLKTDSTLSKSSTGPIANNVVTAEFENKVNKSELAKVATTGSFKDLKDAPMIREFDVVSSSENVSVTSEDDGVKKTYNITVSEKEAPVSDIKVNNVSVIDNKVANISVVNNNATLEFGNTSTIASVGNNNINVTLPAKPAATVTNNTTTLAFGQQKTIATIDGTDVKVTMPAAPPSVSVASKTTTLDFGGTHTIATIDNHNVTVTMPSKPTATVTDYTDTLDWGTSTKIAKIDNTEISVTLPTKPTTNVSVTDYSTTLEWGSINKIAKVGTQDITVTMPSKPSSSTTISASTTFYNNIRYMKYGRMVIVSFDGITKTNLNGAKIPTNSSVGNLNPISDITVYTSCTGYDQSQGDNGYYFGQVILDSGTFTVQNIINGNAKIYGQMMYIISES